MADGPLRYDLMSGFSGNVIQITVGGKLVFAVDQAGNVTAGNNLIVSGLASLLSGLQPSSFGGAQTGTIWGGTGVPANAQGTNGDFYLRFDGTEAGHTLMYHRETGAWVATAL